MGAALPNDRAPDHANGGHALDLLPVDFCLGPFQVGPGGRLTLRDPTQPPGFRFIWNNSAVRAGLREDRLVLRALLGRVPSSVASSVTVRQQVFDALRCLVDAAPKGWKMRLLADHCVAIDVDDILLTPPTITELLTHLTLFVLGFQPYLAFATEAGLEPVLAPGTAKA